jgi:hypothetical protein
VTGEGLAPPDRLALIGRLAALARGLEREGGYNGAKLVRAALEHELLRHADDHRVDGPAALGDAVAEVRQVLAGAYAPEFLESLRAIEPAVRGGATIPLAVAPPARTCRGCGRLILGEQVPSACPDCGAPALTFHEHLPIWFLEPAEAGTMLAFLATGPSRIEACLEGRTDDQLARPPLPGEWSVREALEHLLFAEELMAVRVDRLLREDEPDLAARAVWAETPASDEGSVQTGEGALSLFAGYRALRQATVGRLQELEEAQWGRGGRHAEWGHVTVLSQAAYFARHEGSHLAQIVAAAEGRVPSTG